MPVFFVSFSVRIEDQKIKFEHILAKKCKELELLGDSLVFKEKEVLLQYKEKLELSKIDRNPAMLEKRALLEETDSEDEEDRNYARGKFIIKLGSVAYHLLPAFIFIKCSLK